MRLPILALSAILLAGCTGWPFPGDYAEMPANKETIHRFETASKTSLGNEADITKIKNAVRHTYSDLSVTEIRWVSPTQVIVAAMSNEPDAHPGDIFYVPLSKGIDGWQTELRYLHRTGTP